MRFQPLRDTMSDEECVPMTFKIMSEPGVARPLCDSIKMSTKADKLQRLMEEEVEPEPETVATPPVQEQEEGRTLSARGPAPKRRESFHSLGTHVSWTTLLEYAGDNPEAWMARKVHRWLGVNARDACAFLTELVELRDALEKGENPEKQAGPEPGSVPTPRDEALQADVNRGWFSWMFGSGQRSVVVQAPTPSPAQQSTDEALPSQQPSVSFFSWLFYGGAASNYKVPPTVLPMRATHSDTVEYHLDKLEDIGLLGRGAFGQVTLVRCQTTGQLLALKAVSKGMLVEMQLQHSVMIEKAVMQATSSRFLVKMAATFNREDKLFLLLEAVMGGDLYTVYRMFNFFGSEEHARFYAACAVCGFQHLHSKRILYRDLKMENLVLDLRGYCKLCDFGTSTFEFDAAYTMCGTPEYMPPEVVCGSGHGPAADWWTLGVLVYEMVMAVTPFAEDEPLQIFAKAKLGISQVPGFNDFHTAWSDLVRGLCKQDPLKRLPMLEGGVANVRSQDWFTDVKFDWEALEAGTMRAPHIPQCSGPEDLGNFAGEEQEVPLELPYQDPGDRWDISFEDPVGPREVTGNEPSGK